MKKTILILAMAVFLLTMCGTSRRAWKEEVRLYDGQVILLARTASADLGGEIGGPGSIDNVQMSLRILSPEIRNKPPVWRFPFVPIYMDFDRGNNEWVVVATLFSCEEWRRLGLANLAYIEYRNRKKGWEVVPLSSTLLNRNANLVVGVFSNKRSIVKFEEKNGKNSIDANAYKPYVVIQSKPRNHCEGRK